MHLVDASVLHMVGAFISTVLTCIYIRKVIIIIQFIFTCIIMYKQLKSINKNKIQKTISYSYKCLWLKYLRKGVGL